MPYTANTLRRAESILGYSLSSQAGAREYSVIDGVLYTDVFEGTPTIGGYTGTIKTRFNGSQTTAYKNEIILDKCKDGKYTVTATWGSAALEAELKDLLDWIEANDFTEDLGNSGAKSLKIEDFSITKENADEAALSYWRSISSGWSFYIRTPILLSVSPEQRYDHRYF